MPKNKDTLKVTPVDSCCRVENLTEEPIDGDCVFHCTAYTSDHIQGYFVPYFDYLADRQMGMFGYLAVATSSLVVCGNEVLVGKRSELGTHCPEFFELVPSAGIDRHVDNTEQLLTELVQNTGIDKSAVKDIRPIALIEDTEESTLDICVVIELNEKPVKLAPKEAYSQMGWLSIEEFNQLKAHAKVVPTSKALFEYWLGVHV